MGYQAGRADGVMGRRTETAFRNFQRDKGLNATGQVNDETLAALNGERRGATAGTRSR
jgi:N-acetylmuramoyl-L-alanine amidase